MVVERKIQSGPQITVLPSHIFTPTCGLIADIDISSATVINPGLLGVIGQVDSVLLQTTSQNIRYTLDGTPPTATTGFQLKTTDRPILVSLGYGVILTVIEEAATASLMVQFGGGPCEQPVTPPYSAGVLATEPSDLIAYWQLGETSGLVAADSSGNGRNGVYSGSVVLGETGIGDGSGSLAISTAAASSSVNVYSASLGSAFPDTEGTLMGWAKADNASSWANGVGKFIVSFRGDGAPVGSAIIEGGVRTVSDNLRLAKQGNVTQQSGDFPTTTLEWFFFAWTWTDLGGGVVDYYFRPAGAAMQTVQDTGLTGWVQNLDPNDALIGNRSGPNNWAGKIAHIALWGTPLTAAQITQLSTAV
jgi:hypothetical protein